MLPEGTRPGLRERIVAAACRFGCRSQSGEARSVKRHESQLTSDFDGRNRSGSEIFEAQNSYRRIPQKGFRETHIDRGPEVAHAELASRIVEAMKGSVTNGGTEPQRVPLA